MTVTIPPSLKTVLDPDPIRVVDVGARGGWQPAWHPYRSIAQLIGFEPDEAECRRLRASAAPNELYIGKALYREPATVVLHHYQQPSWTSLYPPNEELLRRLFPLARDLHVLRTERIAATTMDLALREVGIDNVDFIKLDTQGSELDILAGAAEILAGPIFAIVLEVEFVPIYLGQPLFADVDAFLRGREMNLVNFVNSYTRADVEFSLNGSRGYRNAGAFLAAWMGKLRAPQGAYRGEKQLIYGDALYLRAPEAYLASVERRAKDARAQLFKAVTTCGILRYQDCALPYLKLGRDRGILSADDERVLRDVLAATARTPASVLRDLRRLGSRFAHRLAHPRT
jgi:FkbM family methyltransferase